MRQRHYCLSPRPDESMGALLMFRILSDGVGRVGSFAGRRQRARASGHIEVHQCGRGVRFLLGLAARKRGTMQRRHHRPRPLDPARSHRHACRLQLSGGSHGWGKQMHRGLANLRTAGASIYAGVNRRTRSGGAADPATHPAQVHLLVKACLEL
jgi:hypothetical protein